VAPLFALESIDVHPDARAKARVNAGAKATTGILPHSTTLKGQNDDVKQVTEMSSETAAASATATADPCGMTKQKGRQRQEPQPQPQQLQLQLQRQPQVLRLRSG
jgi:hypothetical protein